MVDPAMLQVFLPAILSNFFDFRKAFFDDLMIGQLKDFVFDFSLGALVTGKGAGLFFFQNMDAESSRLRFQMGQIFEDVDEAMSETCGCLMVSG